jgi:cell division protein FtsB
MERKKSRNNQGSNVTIIFQGPIPMKAPFTRFGYALAFLAVATYAVSALTGPKGLHALAEKQKQIHVLENQNAELAKENERLREHIDRLGNDPSEQELELRDRYKLANPRDKVYVLGKPKAQ